MTEQIAFLMGHRYEGQNLGGKPAMRGVNSFLASSWPPSKIMEAKLQAEHRQTAVVKGFTVRMFGATTNSQTDE